MNPNDPPLWQLTAELPGDRLAALEASLEEIALAVSTDEATPDGSRWHLSALFAEEPDRAALEAALGFGDFELAILAPRDWVAESQVMLAPVRAGRFHLHGAHDAPDTSDGVIDLLLEAGRAFGTGQHETTFGCLLALDRLATARKIANPLDLGCGSGVLAMAIARAWKVKVLASDIDGDAVDVTNENSAANGITDLIQAVQADGTMSPILQDRAPYDLIVANILAGPLVELAPGIVELLAEEGVLVLSGLLNTQAEMVLAAYLREGLTQTDLIEKGEWSTLVLGRRI